MVDKQTGIERTTEYDFHVFDSRLRVLQDEEAFLGSEIVKKFVGITGGIVHQLTNYSNINYKANNPNVSECVYKLLFPLGINLQSVNLSGFTKSAHPFRNPVHQVVYVLILIILYERLTFLTTGLTSFWTIRLCPISGSVV